MKKTILLSIIIIIVSVNLLSAQQNSNSPWMQELQKKSSKTTYTFKEIQNAFNTYWEINKSKKDNKGSGFKPFKRWENRWKNTLDKNGMLPKQKQLWNAWNAKNELQRGTTDFSNWETIGPYTETSKSGQGRINTIIVDPSNPNTYYVGAPAGGIWKSTDAGTTWAALSDYLPQIGVSGIVIDHTNSDIIYIATGDDDAGDSYSIGVLKSTDGGTTWNTTGLQFNNGGDDSNEIYMHPTNSNILWVATSNGVYKTINAGTTWNLTLNGNIRDLKVNPNDPTILYAVSSSQFYKSTNGGDSFSQINTGLPSNSNRLAIDVTPANENIVYVLSANGSNGFQGIYKSTDSGNSFTQTAETSDIFGGSTQSWYDMALTVSDTNENIIFVGVLDIWKSTDGGDNFNKLNDWFDSSGVSYTHADIHFLRYFNGHLFCGSDGGVYKSTNDGANFNELNEGLVISQYYRIAVAKQTAANVVGGLQDNGGFAYSNNTWHNYHGGDGMDCAVDPNHPNKYYGFTQFGGSLNTTNNGGLFGVGVASAPENGNWVTPLKINSQGVLYAGYSHLYKLDNNNWQVVSGDVFGGKINRIEIDPINEMTIYVTKSNRLYKSTDAGVSFNSIYSASDFISSVEVNNENNNIIYVTIGGENGDVLKSIDGGNTYSTITGNLPNESKNIIIHQPHSTINDLYVGTDLGVYHINDTMTDWEVFSNNLPNVPVRDLEININDQKIIAGTYGRGVWQSAIETVLPNNDVRIVSITNPYYTCNSSISTEVMVKNEGLQDINQVIINYTIDSTPYNHTYNGTITPTSSQVITLPNSTGLALGEHQINVETTITNDRFSDNNTASNTFIINIDDDNSTTINPFQDNSNAWLTTGAALWEIGDPTTTILGFSNNIGYVTSLTSNYPDNTTSYLVSPCYDLSQLQNPNLKFDMAFDIEEDWDVLYMEYTTNDGITWEVLGTANDPNWYNSNFDANQLTIGKQWSGTIGQFTEYSHTLDFLTNETNIIFRFSFLTDQSVNGEGVLIDNFVIEGQTAGVEDQFATQFTIYPNPSNGIFTIKNSTNSRLDIQIYDITGKLLKAITTNAESEFIMNLSYLDEGIYLAKISEGNKQITKKLMIH